MHLRSPRLPWLLGLVLLAACPGPQSGRDGGTSGGSSGGTSGTSGGTTGGSTSGGTTGGTTSGGPSDLPLGAACETGQCAAGLTCLVQVPGGYCTAACSTANPCPSGGACVEVLPGQLACGLSCGSDGDCTRPGFACDPTCRVCVPAIAVGQLACGAAGGGGRAPDGGACGALPADGGLLSFGPPVDVSASAATESEAEGVLAGNDGGTLVAAYMVVPSDGGLSAPANWIGTSVSTDDGKTFTPNFPLVAASDQLAFDPSLAVDAVGRFYLAYGGAVVQNGSAETGHLWVQTSTDGVSWGAPVEALSPGDVDPDGGAIDKPVLAVSPLTSRPYAAFGEFSGDFGGAGPYQIRLVAGAAGATSFSPGVEIDNGGRPAFRDLPALAFDSSGYIYLAWVESTNLTEVLEDQASGSTLAGGTDQSIWFAVVLPKADGTVAPPAAANVQVNGPADRVVADRPALVASPDGASLYAVYVVGNDNATDVVVATSQDTGADWSAPVHVNADIGCATHFHPAAFLDGKGRLWVSWTDNRDGAGHVFYAVSQDGAQSFSPAALVSQDPFVFDTLDGIPAWLGGYQTLQGSAGELYALYTAPPGGGGLATPAHVFLAKAALP